jgi:hypothetical protein
MPKQPRVDWSIDVAMFLMTMIGLTNILMIMILKGLKTFSVLLKGDKLIYCALMDHRIRHEKTG